MKALSQLCYYKAPRIHAKVEQNPSINHSFCDNAVWYLTCGFWGPECCIWCHHGQYTALHLFSAFWKVFKNQYESIGVKR